MKSIILLAVLAAFVAVAMAEDVKITSGQVEVEVMSTGGSLKMTAMAMKEDDDKDGDDDDDEATTQATTPAATTTTEAPASGGRRRRSSDDDPKNVNVVEMMLTSIQEIDAEGAVIGATNNDSQAIADFSDVEFTVGEPMMESTLMMSKNAKDEAIGSVSVSYEAGLKKSGKFVVNVHIAKEDGNITLNDEMTPVMKDQVKVNMHVEGWMWCTDADANCAVEGADNQVGAALEVTFSVKGKGEASKLDTADGMAHAFDIGSKNTLYVSNQVKTTDDAADDWSAQPDGYPKVMNKDGGVTQITIRIPKFKTSAWYDPSVRLSVPGSDGVSGAEGVAACMTLLIASLLAVFVRL